MLCNDVKGARSRAQPNRTGGGATGLGHAHDAGSEVYGPVYEVGSAVQRVRIAASLSTVIAIRSVNVTPWSASSSTFQPNPTPKTKRPSDMCDSEATCLANRIGSWTATRHEPVPTRNRVVAAAAAARATNGS